MNKIWHELNPMPKKPSIDDRVRWHLDHSKNCGCRKPPKDIQAVIENRGSKTRDEKRG